MPLEPGLTYEKKFIVDDAHTAATFPGARLAPVLSTPHLVGFIEGTAHEAIVAELSGGQSSVGTSINIRHMAATPVGMGIRVDVTLKAVEGRRLLYAVEAWDDVEKIAEGEHERFIIDRDRFMERVEKKASR